MPSDSRPARTIRIHDGLTPPPARDRPRAGQRGTERVARALDDLTVKTTFKTVAFANRQFLDQTLHREVATWRVMLMDGLDRHPLGHGPGRLRQFGAKGIVAFIGYADPINRATGRWADPLLGARPRGIGASNRRCVSLDRMPCASLAAVWHRHQT